jgi:hypothetical protein
VSRRGRSFAAAHFILNSSVKMRWHELYDTPVISLILSVLLMEGWQQLSWSTTEISPLLK